MHAYVNSPNVPRLDIPPTSELSLRKRWLGGFTILLTYPRVQWALRNRARNGLSSLVFESKLGQLLVHEPEFLRWYVIRVMQQLIEPHGKPQALRLELKANNQFVSTCNAKGNLGLR
jgi:hypothetical protein